MRAGMREQWKEEIGKEIERVEKEWKEFNEVWESLLKKVERVLDGPPNKDPKDPKDP